MTYLFKDIVATSRTINTNFLWSPPTKQTLTQEQDCLSHKVIDQIIASQGFT